MQLCIKSSEQKKRLPEAKTAKCDTGSNVKKTPKNQTQTEDLTEKNKEASAEAVTV